MGNSVHDRLTGRVIKIRFVKYIFNGSVQLFPYFFQVTWKYNLTSLFNNVPSNAKFTNTTGGKLIRFQANLKLRSTKRWSLWIYVKFCHIPEFGPSGIWTRRNLDVPGNRHIPKFRHIPELKIIAKFTRHRIWTSLVISLEKHSVAQRVQTLSAFYWSWYMTAKLPILRQFNQMYGLLCCSFHVQFDVFFSTTGVSPSRLQKESCILSSLAFTLHVSHISSSLKLSQHTQKELKHEAPY
jgi:hypothetical protein